MVQVIVNREGPGSGGGWAVQWYGMVWYGMVVVTSYDGAGYS